MRGTSARAGLRGWAIDFAVVTALGVLLGLLGPFGSFFNGPPWQRIAYWLGTAWMNYLVYVAARLVFPRAPTRAIDWIGLVSASILVSLACAWSTWTAAHALWPGLYRIRGLTPLVWYGEGLIVCAVFALILLRRWTVAARSRLAMTASPGLLGADPTEILCLQMEDHYVRVHTGNGSGLVLATMSQAVEALGRVRGLRVHRSWWVAEQAVASAVAEGRNLRLRLINGVIAPVARTSVAAVREAGWLPGSESQS